MINIIPETWDYNDNLEMLYLFYQVSDELLSELTPDTYSLPLHNSMTLLNEIEEIYFTLQKYNIVKNYYMNYIPVIIDEFLDSIESDYLLKRLLGERLTNIRTGFHEAKNNYVLLERWIELFKQACSDNIYREQYKNEIIRIVKSTKDKKNLLYCTRNYYISLISAGYSREFLYTSVKKFFDNRSIRISTVDQLNTFLDEFTCQENSIDFLVLMDIDTIEYLDGISDNLALSKRISKVDVAKEREQLCRDHAVYDLFRDYDAISHTAKQYQKISIIQYKAESVDQFRAIETFEDYIKFLQAFSRYFKHYYPSRQIYKILLKNPNNHYSEVKIPNKLLKRPYVKQAVIDSRIKNTLSAKAMSFSTFDTLAQAIQMHSEALDSKNLTTLLRSFWTSLETLFSNPVSNNQRENVINSILPIIQKTYTLKIMRTLYSQLLSAIGNHNIEDLGISDFKSFVAYFSSFQESSPEMKKIYSLLHQNPLLRARLFEARKSMSSGKKIGELLNKHQVRIEWQLKRLYRTRNIATHIGIELSYVEIVVNHLHNYFDYVVDYILCKSENGDYISSISALVFEAQNDNKIHMELLKNDDSLSAKNYIGFLFGPDTHLINYAFE